MLIFDSTSSSSTEGWEDGGKETLIFLFCYFLMKSFTKDEHFPALEYQLFHFSKHIINEDF